MTITVDAVLGGQLRLAQPAEGYRFATDPVYLAAAVPAQAGETALDLGCGVGTAGLCLAWRTGAAVTGLEVQPSYAALARDNAAANAVPLNVIEGDLRAMPETLKRGFDHVLLNPPWYRASASVAPSDPGRATAFREEATLSEWLAAAARRAVEGGTITVIQRAERLPEILAGLAGVGHLRVLPIAARAGAPPLRVIVQGRKARRGEFRLLAPLIVHSGASHATGGNAHTDAAQSVLADGAALTLP